MPGSLNEDASLWSHLADTRFDGDAIRKYRRTACPVEGDDDVDDFDDDPDSPPSEDVPPPDSPPDSPPPEDQPV